MNAEILWPTSNSLTISTAHNISFAEELLDFLVQNVQAGRIEALSCI
jgi:hypothetical protein